MNKLPYKDEYFVEQIVPWQKALLMVWFEWDYIINIKV